jgi:hypothetical protein
MISRGLLMLLVSWTVGATALGEVPSIKPSHDRPYFMREG